MVEPAARLSRIAAINELFEEATEGDAVSFVETI